MGCDERRRRTKNQRHGFLSIVINKKKEEEVIRFRGRRFPSYYLHSWGLGGFVGCGCRTSRTGAVDGSVWFGATQFGHPV